MASALMAQSGKCRTTPEVDGTAPTALRATSASASAATGLMMMMRSACCSKTWKPDKTAPSWRCPEIITVKVGTPPMECR
jgi:hypothetical protein